MASYAPYEDANLRLGTNNFYRSHHGQDRLRGQRRPLPRFYEPGELLDAIHTDNTDDEFSTGSYSSNTTPHSIEHNLLHNSPLISPPPQNEYHSNVNISHSHSNTPTSTRSSLTLEKLYAVVQKQEELLTKVINNQTELKEKINNFEGDLEALKPSKVSGKKSTERIPRELTNIVCEVIDSSDSKLKPEESSKNEHNATIMNEAVTEVLKHPDLAYDEKIVKRAVKRSFEYRRRKLKMDEKGEEYSEKLLRQKKYRRRKERVYERRCKYVSVAEKKYWKHITYEYMTDESDDDENEGVIILHKHKWRSQYFSQWMAELDRRYTETSTVPSKVCVASKKRIIGSPSQSLPPLGCPTWALDKEWNKPEGVHGDSCESTSEVASFTFSPV